MSSWRSVGNLGVLVIDAFGLALLGLLIAASLNLDAARLLERLLVP